MVLVGLVDLVGYRKPYCNEAIFFFFNAQSLRSVGWLLFIRLLSNIEETLRLNNSSEEENTINACGASPVLNTTLGI